MELRNMTLLPSAVGALCLAATSAVAQVGEIPSGNSFYDHGHGMMWGNNQWGGFGMILGPIFMILIVVGIVAGAIYLLRLFGGTDLEANNHVAQDRALALLKERYAKGEIDSTEFTERKKLLFD